jgi:hypothetical protein
MDAHALRPRIVLAVASGVWLALCVSPAPARAQLTALPRSLAAEALAEQKPFTFHVADFTTEDFAVDATPGAPPDPGIEAHLEPGSLQWVRSARLVVVPRAVLVVSVEGATSGVVSYAGFDHPLLVAGGRARAELPVALLSDDALPIRVRVRRDVQQRAAVFRLRFAPRPEHRGTVLFDSSCSPFGLRVRAGALPADSWLDVGCRLVQTAHGDHTSATLELYLLWDHAGQAVELDGAETRPLRSSLWTYRVNAAPGVVRLAARGSEVSLEYHLPERVHDGFLGLGIGPYYYALRDNRVDFAAQISLLTLYAGYALNPAARIVYFNATALDRRGYSDNGLYVWFEQARMFDQRLSLNLLLGANVLVYPHDGSAVARVSVPQGFELVFRDLLSRNHNLTTGAFLYPRIFGRSYYNVWLRWGTPAFFGEINFIDWREPHRDAASQSRSLGLTFGTAVLRFL